MHCYLDLVYQNWMADRQPASIPLAPAVTGHSLDSVSIRWLPPVRGPLYQRYTLWDPRSSGSRQTSFVLRLLLCSDWDRLSHQSRAASGPSDGPCGLNGSVFTISAASSASSSSAPLLSCADCTVAGVFHQFAYEAASPRVCDTSGYWTPDEAVGE